MSKTKVVRGLVLIPVMAFGLGLKHLPANSTENQVCYTNGYCQVFQVLEYGDEPHGNYVEYENKPWHKSFYRPHDYAPVTHETPKAKRTTDANKPRFWGPVTHETTKVTRTTDANKPRFWGQN